jgi:hypothetical protein
MTLGRTCALTTNINPPVTTTSVMVKRTLGVEDLHRDAETLLHTDRAGTICCRFCCLLGRVIFHIWAQRLDREKSAC